MSGTGLQLALVLFLILLNAFFTGSEIALLSLRETQVNRLRQRGGAGQALARLTGDPNRFLATVQVGITLSGFLASATAAVSLATPLEEPLAFLGGAARPAAIVAVTIVLTYLTLVIGELAPKRLAMQRGERLALLAARPLVGMFRVFRPIVWLLGRSTDVVVRLLGGDPNLAREQVSEEELREMVASTPTISEDQRQILAGAFEVADRTLRQVVRPRREVVAISAETTARAALTALVEAGRSRAPVINKDLDDTVGIVHLRDLLGAPEQRAAELARPALALPETLGVLDALRRMRSERSQLALVIDEYGGVEGIVSLEDLLEEIVGEIYDETDRDLLTIIKHPDGTVELPGGFPVHDLEDLDIDLPEGESATIAGLVMEELGHLPEPGETVSLPGWDLTVLAVERRAVTRVQLTPTGTDSDVDGVADDEEPRPSVNGS